MKLHLFEWKEVSFGAVLGKAFESRCYEPVPRKFAGQGVQYVRHRFPIKGGISPAEVMARQCSKNNVLLQRLLK